MRNGAMPAEPHPWPTDPAVREREYSPSSVIGGDWRTYEARYVAASARAWQTVPGRRDLRYGQAARATLDYFPASAGAVRPGLLIYIHGGYWQDLSPRESAFLAPAWHAAGFAHAVVGYTLAPAARLADIVAQCRTALGWLHARAGELGFDPGNVVVAGSSAGGYLAAACADRAPVPVRGMVPVSGIFDVAPLVGTSINDALGLDERMAAELDLLAPARHYVPAVVAWGAIETFEFKRQSRAFAARLGREGTPCETLEVSGRNHFDVILDLGDPSTALFAAALRLFAR